MGGAAFLHELSVIVIIFTHSLLFLQSPQKALGKMGTFSTTKDKTLVAYYHMLG